MVGSLNRLCLVRTALIELGQRRKGRPIIAKLATGEAASCRRLPYIPPESAGGTDFKPSIGRRLLVICGVCGVWAFFPFHSCEILRRPSHFLLPFPNHLLPPSLGRYVTLGQPLSIRTILPLGNVHLIEALALQPISNRTKLGARGQRVIAPVDVWSVLLVRWFGDFLAAGPSTDPVFD